jgi:hypothetical protein
VETALRDGQLYISAVGQFARVLTPGNEAAVLPRFFGRSAREAAEVVAELMPRAAPPVRAMVTLAGGSATSTATGAAIILVRPAPPAPATKFLPLTGAARPGPMPEG